MSLMCPAACESMAVGAPVVTVSPEELAGSTVLAALTLPPLAPGQVACPRRVAADGFTLTVLTETPAKSPGVTAAGATDAITPPGGDVGSECATAGVCACVSSGRAGRYYTDAGVQRRE